MAAFNMEVLYSAFYQSILILYPKLTASHTVLSEQWNTIKQMKRESFFYCILVKEKLSLHWFILVLSFSVLMSGSAFENNKLMCISLNIFH